MSLRVRGPARPDHPSRFAARQLLFAHAALTDLKRGRLQHDQRIAREGFGVAGASLSDGSLKLRDWSLAILSALEPAPSAEVLARGHAAVTGFCDQLRSLVAHRRAHPGDPQADVLTRLIQGEADGEQLSEAEGFDKIDGDYFRALLTGAVAGAADMEQLIAPLLDRAYKSLSPVERGILLLAGYEFKSQIEVPYRVIINEAIELAKSFGGTDGHKYVNGVLDKMAMQLRAVEFNAARA